MKKLKDILKIIFLVLAILTMTCTLAKKASAESMIQSDRDYIHSVIGDDWDATQWATVDSYMDTMPYFMLFPRTDFVGDYVLVLLPYSSNQYFEAYKNNGYSSIQNVSVTEPQIIPWFEKASGTNWETTNSFQFGYYYGGLMPYSLGNLQWDSNRGQYSYCIFDTWDHSLGTYGYGVEIYDRLYSDSGWNFYWYNRTHRGKSGFYGSNGSFTVETDWNNVKTNYNALFIAHSYTGFRYIEQNVFPVSYTEDSRLKLSTFSLPSGGEYLQTDIRKIVKDFPISDSSHSSMGLYPEEEINMTISYVDDNDQVTTEDFVLSSDNSVISSKYIFSTDFEIFGDFSDYKDVYVSAVSFSLAGSSQGQEGVTQETYNIACEYYLKQYVNPISPAEIEEPTYEDSTVVPQSEIEDTIDRLESSSSSSPNAFSGEWVFEQNHPVPPSWADHLDFRVIYSNVDSIVSAFVQKNIWHYYRNNDIDALDWTLNSFNPDTFSYDNAHSRFYDMIIISVYSAKVWADTTSATPAIQYSDIVLQGYIVFYSDRYFIHQQSITQQNILSSLEYSAYNASLYYGYMYDQLQDFELKSLLAMGSLIDYAKKENNLLSTIDLDINNSSDNIVDAIHGIRFNPDYTPLISEMELIRSAVINIPSAVRSDLTYLFMPTYDGISVNFNQYHDDIGILALPFDETKLVYDTMKNNYTGNFEIDVPKLKVSGFTIYDGTHFSFDVWSLFDGNKLASSDGTGLGFVKGLRYFIAFVAILGSVASTYAHIFRRENTQD